MKLFTTLTFLILSLNSFTANASARKLVKEDPSFLCQIKSLATSTCLDKFIPGDDVLLEPSFGRGSVIFDIEMSTMETSSIEASGLLGDGPYIGKLDANTVKIFSSRLNQNDDTFTVDLNSGVGKFYKASGRQVYIDMDLANCKIVSKTQAETISEKITNKSLENNSNSKQLKSAKCTSK
jgi:hypothetical protein